MSTTDTTCLGPLGCGHVHAAGAAGRCWEAPCAPECPCNQPTAEVNGVTYSRAALFDRMREVQAGILAGNLEEAEDTRLREEWAALVTANAETDWWAAGTDSPLRVMHTGTTPEPGQPLPQGTWIRIEREHSRPLMVGPYPTEAAAEHALEHAPLIDAECQEDCTDAYTTDEPPANGVDDEIALVDLENPDHTGA